MHNYNNRCSRLCFRPAPQRQYRPLGSTALLGSTTRAAIAMQAAPAALRSAVRRAARSNNEGAQATVPRP